ncbi:MAG: endonuclease/exonuclease/phosphatase family protein [Phycisphaeraceae bacterium]|nr:endonuclease/exonuclease/phosphatase family protein [Phycisphaeraceae bacterium]
MHKALIPLVGLAAFVTWGCASSPPRANRMPASASTSAAARADEQFVYFHFNPGDDKKTIQDSDETVALLLDSDGNPATGYQRPEKPFAGIGADLEVQFSPQNPKGGAPGHGVAFFRLDKSGARSELKREDSDFMFAPTYASQWYDARMSRFFSSASGLPTAGMGSRGKGRGAFVIYDQRGRIVGYSDPFEIEFPSIAGGPKLSNDGIPAKSPSAIRVMAWNVWGKLQDSPEKFCAVIRAINPDVIMLSEWKGDASALEQTLNKHMPGEIGAMVAWNAAVGPDVAVASKFPLRLAGPNNLEMHWNGERRTIRFVSAAVQTPIGPALIGAMHLKCCGAIGSNEDALRVAEADVINQAMKQISRADAADIRVLGGDLNLVGSRVPLDVLRLDIDADGSDLAIADAIVLGDDWLYTWRDWNSGFSPGRLDWLTYSDASAQAARQFVFDPARLSDSALAKIGLKRADAQPSDHLPVVIDLVPIAK